MKSTRSGRMVAMLTLQVKEFSRDYGGIFLTFAFPFMFVVSLFASNMMNPVVKFKFGIVDTSHNSHSQLLVDALALSPSVQAKSIGREEGLTEVREGTLHALVVIPAGDFQIGAQPLELVVTERYQPIAQVILQATIARLSAAKRSDLVRFDTVAAGDKVRSEFTYVFPGILAIALLQMGLFVTAVPMLQARDRGTYRYLSLTPLRIPEFLASQIVFRYAIALTQIFLLLMAGSFILKLSPAIWIAVVGVACLGVLMMVSIGYVIAGVAPNLQVGMAMVMVAEFGMIFGGSVFWDANTSKMLFYVAHCVPLSYLADMFRQVITGMPGLWPLWLDGLAVIGWSLLAMLVAAKKFRFDTPMRGAASRLKRHSSSAVRAS